MTNIRDVIKLVEIAFYDYEYSPTNKELEAMLKILKTIYIHNKLNRAMHHTPTAIASQKSGVFHNTISSYMHHIEKRQQILSTALICHS